MTGTSAPPARLTRSTQDRKVAGVCGGIGRYLGIDPVIPRVVFVVASLIGGSGVLVYLVAWMLMPESGDLRDVEDRSNLDPKTSRTAGMVVLCIGTVVLFGGWDWSGEAFVPILLIGGGVWLVMRSRNNDDDVDDDLGERIREHVEWASPSWPSPDPDQRRWEDASADRASEDDVEEDEEDEEDELLAEARRLNDLRSYDLPFDPPAPPPAPTDFSVSTRRRRPVTALITLGVLLILGGALCAAAASGAAIDVEVALLAALAITSAGLLIGAFTGGARGLVGVAALLVLALTGVNSVDLSLAGGIGDRTYEVEQVADLADSYRLGIGDLVVDLSALDVDDLPRTTNVDVGVGIGEVTVVLPDGVRAEITASVSAGSVHILGRSWDGTGLSITQTVEGPEGAPLIELDVHNGLGEVRVR